MVNEKACTLKGESLFSKTRVLTIKMLMFLFVFILFFPVKALIAGDMEKGSSGIGESAQTMISLELKKGYYYRYIPLKEESNIYQDVYVTDETDDAWKGIIATVLGEKVTFQHFELNKDNLILKRSENMRKSEVMVKSKLYSERRGEAILAFSYLDQPGETDVILALVKPYILLESKNFKLADVGEKDFSISEYEKYESYPEIPKLGKFQIASYELKTDGTMALELENKLSEDREVTFIMVGTKVTRVNQILPAQGIRQLSFATGQTGSAGQEYSVFVEIRFRDPKKKQTSTSSREFKGIYGQKKEYGE